MKKNCLHIYNPEHDYALGVGNKRYYPKARILNLRKEMCLFPALYANNEDLILLQDTVNEEDLKSLKYFDIACQKKIKIIGKHQIKDLLEGITDIRPWGWDFSIIKMLEDCGVSEKFLLSNDKIELLRNISHRRTALEFQSKLQEIDPNIKIEIGKEIKDPKIALDILKIYPYSFFKAPWSSSGRGVINSEEIKPQLVEEWLRGMIRRQGSVIWEKGYRRTGDFATEWFVKNGEVSFLGLSYFKTRTDGRYLKNYSVSQKVIWNKLKELAPEWSEEIINSQSEVLKDLIAPHYSGPLGIDMFTDVTKKLNPCVEINLRMTMGIVSLIINENLKLDLFNVL